MNGKIDMDSIIYMNGKIDMDSKNDLTVKNVKLLDTTLRDGSYAVDFHFSSKLVIELLKKLNEASVELIEVGHGLGLEAELTGVRECNIDIEEWSKLCNQYLSTSSWGMFVQPKFSRLSTMDWLCKEGMTFIRVGMEAQNTINNLDYIEACLKFNKDVYLNIMKTSNITPCELMQYLDVIPKEIKGVYIVDSCGTMLPSSIEAYVHAVKGHYENVGFHGHDNLGMANANSLAAIKAGATIVDGTLSGIGRGSGNASTESLAAILTSQNKGNYNLKELCKLADYCVKQLDVIPCDRYFQILGGVFGVHTSFFPLVEQLSNEFQVNSSSVMKLASQISPFGIKESDIRRAAKKLASEQCELN